LSIMPTNSERTNPSACRFYGARIEPRVAVAPQYTTASVPIL
jgi:hypothetical protein